MVEQGCDDSLHRSARGDKPRQRRVHSRNISFKDTVDEVICRQCRHVAADGVDVIDSDLTLSVAVETELLQFGARKTAVGAEDCAKPMARIGRNAQAVRRHLIVDQIVDTAGGVGIA